VPPVETASQPAASERDLANQIATAADASGKVAPATEQGALSGLVDKAFETIVATFIVLLGGLLTWVSTQVQKWTGGRVQLDKMLEAVEWEGYAREGLRRAKIYATNKTGLTPEKLDSLEKHSTYISYVLTFMNSQYDDIMKEWDKNENGAIDWIETELPPVSPALQTKKVARKFTPKVVPKTPTPPSAPVPA